MGAIACGFICDLDVALGRWPLVLYRIRCQHVSGFNWYLSYGLMYHVRKVPLLPYFPCEAWAISINHPAVREHFLVPFNKFFFCCCNGGEKLGWSLSWGGTFYWPSLNLEIFERWCNKGQCLFGVIFDCAEDEWCHRVWTFGLGLCKLYPVHHSFVNIVCAP